MDFANKLYGTNEIAKSARFSKPKLNRSGFTIDHYAGAVTYKTENFLIKNKDFVVAEHQQLMQNSSVKFVRGLFPPEPEDAQADKVSLQEIPGFPLQDISSHVPCFDRSRMPLTKTHYKEIRHAMLLKMNTPLIKRVPVPLDMHKLPI